MMQSDSDSEIIQPPTDLITRTIVEKAASFISKKGIEFEKKILLDDPRYNFLRNTEDPSHAYYKHKLAEYSSQNHQDQEDEDDDVIDTPPDVTTLTLVKRMARLVSQKGLAFERMVALRNKNDPRFSFLWSSFAPYRDFYQHRLYDFYKKQAHDQAIDFNNDVVVGVVDEPKMLPLPKLLQYRIPKRMTMKERDIIKVTALFTAWYGVDFLGDSKICRFEFIKESDADDDSRFSLFTEFVVAYSEVLKMTRKEELRDMLRKNEAYKSTIFDGFFYRIRSDVLEEHKWLEFGERVIIDWHDSVVKEFAKKENPIVAIT